MATRYISTPITVPSDAWGIAAQWGSAMTSGDPGACMYGFDERFCVQSEEHRAACLLWIEQCKATATRAGKRELKFLAEYIEMAPVSKGTASPREFRLNAGTPAAARDFRALDTFTAGYVEAMFFTNTGTGDDEDLEDATVADLAPKTRAAIIADCERFQRENIATLGDMSEDDKARAGRDFWFTRNGHGVGFWESGRWPDDIGATLNKASKAFRYLDMYRGDDGQIYLA